MKRKLQILDHTGHTTVEFDEANVAEAMAKFQALVKEAGYTAAVKTGDGTHRVVREFDPTAEETLIIPRLKGG